jgi:hypothetical protein
LRVFFSVSFVSTPLRNANARVFLVGVFFVKLLSSGCVHLSSVCYVLSVHLIRTNPKSKQKPPLHRSLMQECSTVHDRREQHVSRREKHVHRSLTSDSWILA